MIEYLEIKIKRCKYADEHTELQGEVFVDGKTYAFLNIVPINDFASVFEKIWERGGQEVLKIIKKDISDPDAV